MGIGSRFLTIPKCADATSASGSTSGICWIGADRQALPRPAVAPDPAHPQAGEDTTSGPTRTHLPGQTVSTDAFIGQLDQYTIEYGGDNPLDGEQDQNDDTRSQAIDEDWG